MKRWAIFGLSLIVVTNLFVFSNILANRFLGEVNTLTLSERELKVPYNYGLHKEDSSLVLDINWRVKHSDADGYWYNRQLPTTPEKIVSLGFQLPDESNSRRFTHQLEQELYWLIEFDGSAYREVIKRLNAKIDAAKTQFELDGHDESKKELKRLQELLEQELEVRSRLFVIDVAARPEALDLEEATDEYFIVVGRVKPGVHYDYQSKEKPQPKSYYLHLRDMSVESIYVPLAYSKGVRQKVKNQRNENIQYSLVVNWGSQYEPWVTDFILTRSEN